MSAPDLIITLRDEDGDEFPFAVPASASDPVAYAFELADEAREAGHIEPAGELVEGSPA